MKTELRLKPHSGLPGQNIIEIWYGKEFIGQVTGADQAGVRVISKYPTRVIEVLEAGTMVVEVRINEV